MNIDHNHETQKEFNDGKTGAILSGATAKRGSCEKNETLLWAETLVAWRESYRKIFSGRQREENKVQRRLFSSIPKCKRAPKVQGQKYQKSILVPSNQVLQSKLFMKTITVFGHRL